MRLLERSRYPACDRNVITRCAVACRCLNLWQSVQSDDVKARGNVSTSARLQRHVTCDCGGRFPLNVLPGAEAPFPSKAPDSPRPGVGSLALEKSADGPKAFVQPLGFLRADLVRCPLMLLAPGMAGQEASGLLPKMFGTFGLQRLLRIIAETMGVSTMV